MSQYHQVEIDHNVYILGAGFSFDAGIPLINDFLNRMRDSLSWLYSQGRNEEAQAINNVFDFRRQAAAAAERVVINLENIEDLFSLASASAGPDLANDVTTAIAATIDFARSTAQEYKTTIRLNDPSYKVPQSWGEEGHLDQGFKAYHSPIYDRYAGILSGQFCEDSSNMKNTILSFNYDTVLEDALANLGIRYDYGFSTGLAHYATKFWSSNGEGISKNPTPSLKILKLHGSINWGIENQTTGAIYIRDSYAQIKEKKWPVLIVPPTWRKIIGGVLANVWERALEAIGAATRIIVIGFSMPPTDMHFKYLLAAGLKNNISLRSIVFVNPAASQLSENLFKILRKELSDQGIVRTISQDTFNFLAFNKGVGLINRKYKQVFRDV